MARLFGPAGMARLLVRRLFPRPEQAPLRRRFLEHMARNEKRAYVASQRAVVGWSVLDRIGAIAAPVLVVASERDYWPVADKEAYARRMQRAEVAVVADAGHALLIEAPDRNVRGMTNEVAHGRFSRRGNRAVRSLDARCQGTHQVSSPMGRAGIGG